MNAVLKISCKDKKGIIAKVTNFIFNNSGNIVTLNEFVDPIENIFFMRIEWNIDDFKIPREKMQDEIKKLSKSIGTQNGWELFFSDQIQKMAIMVSKYDHCLYDLLLRKKSGELEVEIPMIISNHKSLKHIADTFGIDFQFFDLNKTSKDEIEKEQIKIIKNNKIDFIVLARYMQILSKEFVDSFKNKIINIHHSFLPAFEGARPYHQAYERGVKIIGATSHFVSSKLDKGPIIRQGVAEVTHKDNVNDLMIKGRDLEKTVLADAVKLYLQHRLFVTKNRTIIF